jgi:glyoxylase-like metal-dependent hydrolase (beta-lactamase superfamily II)
MTPLTDFTARPVTADTALIGSHFPLPGLGVLPINAFVIRAQQPVLVDTGLAAERATFLAALRATIEPAELRWIWITHMDADHVGNLREVLTLAPQARVVTSYLGLGKMGLLQLPQDRVHLLNPGQTLDVGDRQLLAVRPPSYDAPETTGLFDQASRILFTADCFGTLMERPVQRVEELGARLRDGLVTWATIDAPWLGSIDTDALGAACHRLTALRPTLVLGSHSAEAEGGMLAKLTEHLLAACNAAPFVGPDQAQFEQAMGLRKAA